MHELIHLVEHATGLCGEKHLNLVAITEFPNFKLIFNYIRFLCMK
jgi:hypothetical protein